MCGTGSHPPKCMGSAVYGPGGCTCGDNKMTETCPRCGALPCDQTMKPVREAIEIERMDIETRFWSIVDQDGLTGLPSDMWAALETLVSRAARAGK